MKLDSVSLRGVSQSLNIGYGTVVSQWFKKVFVAQFQTQIQGEILVQINTQRFFK